ncbi:MULTISPECIES: DUF6658 family protein [unclassified Microcoleus]|uniref:DUF6658 family protein n=1 Tax=unclassified Microcoleus TaxID=2642155 RepID=UPI002FCFF928
MNTVTAFFKRLRIGQFLTQFVTVFMAGLLVFTSTACNAGDVRGARPDNPPVQMGGMNNPHKAGGDGYTNYQMSTDPKVNQSPAKDQKNRADLSIMGDGVPPRKLRLLASTTAESNSSKLLYPGSAPMETDKFDSELGGDKALLNAPDGQPAKAQPVFDRSDPDANILERVGAAFKDASGFLKDSAEDAKESSVTKLNPLQK